MCVCVCVCVCMLLPQGNPSMPEVRMTWRAPEARVATPRPKRVTPAYDRLPSPATAPATPNPEPATPAAPVTSAAATPAPPQEPQTNNNNNVPAKPWTPYTDKSPSPAPFKVDLKAGQALRAARMAAFGWPYSSPQVTLHIDTYLVKHKYPDTM